MSLDIIPMFFEDHGIRVVDRRTGEPWFVAKDVCAALDIKNVSQALGRVDDEDKAKVNLIYIGQTDVNPGGSLSQTEGIPDNTLCQTDGIPDNTLCQTDGIPDNTLCQTDGIPDNTLSRTEGSRGNPNAWIISRSAVLWISARSDKPEAVRLWKWVTKIVLPSIMDKGYYVHPGTELPHAPQETVDMLFGVPLPILRFKLDWVMELRKLMGPECALEAARNLDLPGIPAVARAASRVGAAAPSEGFAALAHLLDHLGAAIMDARDNGTDALAPEGLRCRVDGLFVGNGARQVFDGTRWARGAHAAALAALPGVGPAPNPLTLARVGMRGLILPWALIDGEDVV